MQLQGWKLALAQASVNTIWVCTSLEFLLNFLRRLPNRECRQKFSFHPCSYKSQLQNWFKLFLLVKHSISVLVLSTSEKQITAFLKPLRRKCSSPTNTYSWPFPADFAFCWLLVFRSFWIFSTISWATALFLKYQEENKLITTANRQCFI